jgi:hypothetical protein
LEPLEICEDRYQIRSLILTSQLPVARWHEQIGDPMWLMASSTAWCTMPIASRCGAIQCVKTGGSRMRNFRFARHPIPEPPSRPNERVGYYTQRLDHFSIERPHWVYSPLSGLWHNTKRNIV